MLMVEERLQSKLRTTPDGCHEWTGSTKTGGYGIIRHEGRRIMAHRMAWTLLCGPIPEGLHVLHKCDNPPCCNPEHLFLGTNADNVRDKVSKGRSFNGRAALTHCKNGHQFTPENTYMRPDGVGWRQCRACNRAAVARAKARKKGAA